MHLSSLNSTCYKDANSNLKISLASYEQLFVVSSKGRGERPRMIEMHLVSEVDKQ